MTLNFGIRYDYQVASVLPSTSAAVPGFEKYLPAVTAPGRGQRAASTRTVQPRVGITYALDESRKTQLRATYAMFTDQIGSGAAGFLSVAQYRYLYYDVEAGPGPDDGHDLPTSSAASTTTGTTAASTRKTRLTSSTSDQQGGRLRLAAARTSSSSAWTAS